MGTSIRYFIGGEPMGAKHRKCDGKSLADYYLAVMADGMGIDELLGSVFGGQPLPGSAFDGQPRQDTNEKVIRYDFRKNQPQPEQAQTADRVFPGNLRLLSAYFEEVNEGRRIKIDLAALETLISRIRTGIADYRGSLFNIVGTDVTRYRDGAIEDCDDVLTAIALCRKRKKSLRISLG